MRTLVELLAALKSARRFLKSEEIDQLFTDCTTAEDTRVRQLTVVRVIGNKRLAPDFLVADSFAIDNFFRPSRRNKPGWFPRK